MHGIIPCRRPLALASTEAAWLNLRIAALGSRKTFGTAQVFTNRLAKKQDNFMYGYSNLLTLDVGVGVEARTVGPPFHVLWAIWALAVGLNSCVALRSSMTFKASLYMTTDNVVQGPQVM